jgi:hypothetical protein
MSEGSDKTPVGITFVWPLWSVKIMPGRFHIPQDPNAMLLMSLLRTAMNHLFK